MQRGTPSIAINRFWQQFSKLALRDGQNPCARDILDVPLQ